MKGTYEIGFKNYNIYDVSRQNIFNKDTIPRPLLIHFWYHSQELKNDSYNFKNYIDLIAIREDFYKSFSDVDDNSYNFVNAYAEFAKRMFGCVKSAKSD